MSGEMFNGRVGVIIEVAPNRFAQYVLKEVAGDMSLNCEESELLDFLEYPVPGPVYADIRISGRLVSKEEAARPAWMPAERAAEIAAVRALDSGACRGELNPS